MITRNITTTHATVSYADFNEGVIKSERVSFTGVVKSEKKLARLIEKEYGIIAGQITEIYTTTAKYGITEEDFINNAVVISVNN